MQGGLFFVDQNHDMDLIELMLGCGEERRITVVRGDTEYELCIAWNVMVV